jgi:hypothetical protein
MLRLFSLLIRRLQGENVRPAEIPNMPAWAALTDQRPAPVDPIATIREASNRSVVRPQRYTDGTAGYADIATVFVDELILRYFHSIIVWVPGGQAPWYDLCLSNKWLASMPELWERLTGYELTKAQKDLAAVAIIERLRTIQGRAQLK